VSFSDGQAGTLSSIDLIDVCRQRWCRQWANDTAKPQRIPTKLDVSPIVTGHRPAHYPDLELRVIRLAVTGPDKARLTDGTPPGLKGCADEQ
jgi:hypothetical protein